MNTGYDNGMENISIGALYKKKEKKKDNPYKLTYMASYMASLLAQ